MISPIVDGLYASTCSAVFQGFPTCGSGSLSSTEIHSAFHSIVTLFMFVPLLGFEPRTLSLEN